MASHYVVNSQVVHAGMMPNWPLENQTEYIMTLMRNLEDDGNGGWIPHEETDDGKKLFYHLIVSKPC